MFLTRICPSVCPHGEGGYLPWPGPRSLPPNQVLMGEGVHQGTYPPAQGTYPLPGPDRGGGTPRYLPTRSNEGRWVPQGTYPPSQVLTGGRGIPRYLPPSCQVAMGMEYPKVPIPLVRSQWRGGGYPKIPTPHPRYLSLKVPSPSQVPMGGGVP